MGVAQMGVVLPYDDFNFFPDHPIGDFTVADDTAKQEDEKKFDEDLENKKQ